MKIACVKAVGNAAIELVQHHLILLSKPFAQEQLLTAVSQLLNADSQTV
jgi:hypothetical protein